MENTEIIDFELKGNVVRFWLGKNGKQWGDDWNDAPYESNAGSVYKEHVKGHIDLVFAFDSIVMEPSDTSQTSSQWTKEDMMNRKVPCVIVLPAEHVREEDSCLTDFDRLVGDEQAVQFYFGDGAEVIAEKIKKIGGIL